MKKYDYFSTSYEDARQKFIAAAAMNGASHEVVLHPTARGINNEELAIDVALWGVPSAEQILILTSGMHGVEGFCGSGCQISAFQDPQIKSIVEDGRVCILFVHALNPFGFSHKRRGNEDNIDLNRNFVNFDKLPKNEAYAELHNFLIPDHWPPSQENEKALNTFVTTHGFSEFQESVSSGQYEFSDGIFYGGTSPAWSNLELRKILRKYGVNRKRVVWIDVHSGLGEYATGEKIYSGPHNSELIDLARLWWGSDVTSTYEKSSSSAILNGAKWMAFEEECAEVERLCLTVEFGILPTLVALRNLRAEQFLRNRPGEIVYPSNSIHDDFFKTFFDESFFWKQSVVDQSNEILKRALTRMSE